MKLFSVTLLLAVWTMFFFCETEGSHNEVKSDMISKGNIYSKSHENYNQSDMETTGHSEIYIPGGQYADVNGTTGDLRIVKRIYWVAQPPLGPRIDLTLPVSTVIIHHTDTESCRTQSDCILQTRKIQTSNIKNRLNDIEFNFLIGGDAAVYEGRGWKVEGEHTLGVNDKSFGVAFIGTFSEQPPPKIMINALYKLLDIAIQMGYLTKDYKIMGASQISNTESPGKAFYELIKLWPHWFKEL